jgi:hypothetical protein
MKKFVIALGILVGACVVAVLLGAIDRLAAFAGRLDPLFGQIVFWSLATLIVLTILYLAVGYLSLSVALVPPNKTDGSEYARYLDNLRRRLKRNPYLKGRILNTKSEIDDALQQILKPEADAVIRRTATTVFITTAAMQNGRLDGIAVLLTQTRMVWQIAKLYVQRPSLRDMSYLYLNVAGTALIAANIEDVDLTEVFAPLTVSTGPAVAAGIPFVGGVGHFVLRCVSNGAANAFLTLRVGEIARRYCEATSRPERGQLRAGATAEAVSHLMRIVGENLGIVKTTIRGSVEKRFKWPWVREGERAASEPSV